MNPLELSEQEAIRRNSLATLRQMGIEPYPAALYPVDATSTDIRANFKDDAAEQRQVFDKTPEEPIPILFRKKQVNRMFSCRRFH